MSLFLLLTTPANKRQGASGGTPPKLTPIRGDFAGGTSCVTHYGRGLAFNNQSRNSTCKFRPRFIIVALQAARMTESVDHNVTSPEVCEAANSPSFLTDVTQRLETFTDTGLFATVDDVIASLDAACKDCIDNETLIAYLRVLSRACLLRFVKSRDTDDVDRAVEAKERVVALVDPGPARLQDLNRLGGILKIGYDVSRAKRYLARSIDVMHEAASLLEGGSPDQLMLLTNLCELHLALYESERSSESLTSCINLTQQVLDLMPSDDPDHPDFLLNLSSFLRNRNENASDLTRAVSLLEEALILAPKDSLRSQNYLANLGICLRMAGEATKSQETLQRSVKSLIQLVEGTPVGQPARFQRIIELCKSFKSLFELVTVVDDIGVLLDILEDATQDPMIPGRHLAVILDAFAATMKERFNGLGRQLRDLDYAILFAERAAALSVPQPNPQTSSRYDFLGILLRTKFDHIGSLDDLNRAIDMHEFAVASDTSTAVHRHNLSVALQRRIVLTGSDEDSMQAIELMKSILSTTTVNSIDHASMSNTLGCLLLNRDERNGNLVDLLSAIDVTSSALSRPDIVDDVRSNLLQTISICLLKKFQGTGEVLDLENARDAAEQAVNLTPIIHSH